MAKKIKEMRSDGWQSLITGIGTAQDKRMSNTVHWDQRTSEFWEQLYAGDELASRIVNVVPEEALRKWVTWSGVEKESQVEVEKRCQDLDLRASIERAWKWGRAYGGAVLYIVTDTADPASPLEKGERVIGLRDLSRYDLRILSTDVEADFGSPNWGNPNIYYLTVQMGSKYKGYPIHWTRMVRFDGAMVPRRTYIRNNYWHDSVINKLFNVIRNYQSANDAAASTLQDFSVGIYKMKNLANLISAGKEDIVKRRIEMLHFSRSTIRAMVIDADDEDYIDLSRSVSGLAELLSQQSNRLVAATDIPHTVLLGESPDGSNATGNSTTSQWFHRIQSEQENYLRPKLRQLCDAIFHDMPDLQFKFKPLQQLSELEEAELRSKQAATDTAYISAQVLDPAEVANSRFGAGTYSTETQLDEEARAMASVPDNQLLEETEEPEEVSLQKTGNETPLNPMGVEIDRPDSSGTGFQMKHQEIQAPEKTKGFVSISMSEPLRDPKTDPQMKSPGKPNKPRSHTPTVGDGVLATSGVAKEKKE